MKRVQALRKQAEDLHTRYQNVYNLYRSLYSEIVTELKSYSYEKKEKEL
jgi:acyl carrier protein phosphodiesterase